MPVDTGTYYFSEVSPGANYTTTFACEGTDADPTSVGGSDYVYSLAVAKGENAVCTFTNTRDQGSVQLVKSWGTGTVGETILNIGTGTTDATDDDVATEDLTGDDKGPGSTTSCPWTPAPTTSRRSSAWSQLHYDLRLLQKGAYRGVAAHLDREPLRALRHGRSQRLVRVATGDDVVCTFTDARDRGSIELVKKLGGQRWPDDPEHRDHRGRRRRRHPADRRRGCGRR